MSNGGKDMYMSKEDLLKSPPKALALAREGRIPDVALDYETLSVRHKGIPLAMALAVDGNLFLNLMTKNVLDLEYFFKGKPTGWRVRDTLAFMLEPPATVPANYYGRLLLALKHGVANAAYLTNWQLAAARSDGWTIAHQIARWGSEAKSRKHLEMLCELRRRLEKPPLADLADRQGMTVGDILKGGQR